MNTLKNKPVFWIPTLYLAEGLPYTMVIFLSVFFFKLAGLSNTDATFYTSWMYLPWLYKPLWSPIVEMYKTSKFWISVCQIIMGAAFGLIGLTLPLDQWMQYSLILLWLIAFTSATNDIATDGFYINALNKEQQATWIGIRSTFYKIAMLICQGGLVFLAGHIAENSSYNNLEIAASQEITKSDNKYSYQITKINDTTKVLNLKLENLEENEIILNITINGQGYFAQSGELTKSADEGNITDNEKDTVKTARLKFNQQNKNKNRTLTIINSDKSMIFVKPENIKLAWGIVFGVLGLFLVLTGFYHAFILPKSTVETNTKLDKNYFLQIKEYFHKEHIWLIIGILLLYRLGEAQLSSINILFLQDNLDKGGLGLSTQAVGTINGTIGVIAMFAGGILGGIALSKKGLKFWLIPMILILNVPDILYAIMAHTQTQNLVTIASMVSIEQFGYGFGFTAYSIFMVEISKGKYTTSHYAISTAFMAAGMMIPKMFSGFLQNVFGYQTFFIWVTLCAIPSLFLAYKLLRSSFFTNDEAE